MPKPKQGTRFSSYVGGNVSQQKSQIHSTILFPSVIFVRQRRISEKTKAAASLKKPRPLLKRLSSGGCPMRFFNEKTRSTDGQTGSLDRGGETGFPELPQKLKLYS